MKNGNQAAFATGTDNWNQIGLSKREYFAGIAMGAILSGESRLISNEPVTERAVKYADALLKQLEQ